MPGLLPLFQESGDGRETITTAYLPLEANYSTHMPNEKPRPWAGPGLHFSAPGWPWGKGRVQQNHQHKWVFQA